MISLYNALAESETEIAAIKLDWRINLKQDAQEAVRDFTQLLIDLTGHKYDVDRIVDLNDENKEKQFRDLVVKAEDAPTFWEKKCLLNLDKKYLDRVTQFFVEICGYDFLLSEAGINWLDAVCGMTFAMLSYRGKGDIIGEWQKIGGSVRMMLLKGLSDTRKSLTQNKDKEKQYLVNLLVKILPDVCKDLMVDEMDRIFTCPATAEWAATMFFELMNKHTDLYCDEERFLDKYFKILTYEAKLIDEATEKEKKQRMTEGSKITKLALESLDYLLGEAPPESREKVIEFIRRDADTNMLRRMLNDSNLTMVRLCLRLVNAMQEAEGRESIFSDEASKEIHLLVLEKNKEVRASAARFMNLTMEGEELLRRTLEMVIQYEVSTDDIFNIIDNVWDPEAFSQWKTYWTILCKDSRLATSYVITKMITYVLDKMKNIAIINKQIAQKKMFEHVIDFVKTYGNCLKYLRNHGEWKKYKYFLCISDVINVEFYKPESIQSTKPLRIILEELLKAIKIATDTESIFKAISLFVRFDKVCKQGDKKHEENTYDGLINEIVPNSFNTLIQEFDQLKTAESASTQFEQSVIILGAAIHCGVQLTNAEMKVIFDQKLPTLLEPKTRKKFKRPCGLYILAFGVYIYFWRSYTASKAKMDVVRVTKLFDTLFYLFEDLLTAVMDNKDESAPSPNFSCSKVFHFACLAFSILVSSPKIITPYITPEITLKRLSVLSRFIEFFTFERKRIGLIPQWTTMICKLSKHLPPNTATSRIVKYWVTADVADKEIFSLLKELKKQSDVYIQIVTITLLDLCGNDKHTKLFLKKFTTLYDITARPGYDELLGDSTKILVAIIERQKQLTAKAAVNRFEALDKVDSLLNRVLKSNKQTQALFNALKEIPELSTSEKAFMKQLKTKLLQVFPSLK